MAKEKISHSNPIDVSVVEEYVNPEVVKETKMEILGGLDVEQTHGLKNLETLPVPDSDFWETALVTNPSKDYGANRQELLNQGFEEAPAGWAPQFPGLIAMRTSKENYAKWAQGKINPALELDQSMANGDSHMANCGTSPEGIALGMVPNFNLIPVGPAYTGGVPNQPQQSARGRSMASVGIDLKKKGGN